MMEFFVRCVCMCAVYANSITLSRNNTYNYVRRDELVSEVMQLSLCWSIFHVITNGRQYQCGRNQFDLTPSTYDWYRRRWLHRAPFSGYVLGISNFFFPIKAVQFRTADTLLCSVIDCSELGVVVISTKLRLDTCYTFYKYKYNSNVCLTWGEQLMLRFFRTFSDFMRL